MPASTYEPSLSSVEMWPQTDLCRLFGPPPALCRLSSFDSVLQHQKSRVETPRLLPSRSLQSLCGQSTGTTTPTGSLNPAASSYNSLLFTSVTQLSSTSPTPFRSVLAEYGFCISTALTMLLGEYLVSGFSVLGPSLLSHFKDADPVDFWPATLLSLVQCATILTFARFSDMYGGYPVFIFGASWLGVFSLAAGFAPTIALLDVCGAMQGLAVAAFTPSAMALFGSIYPPGPRRNLALGIYGSCAPIGFFAGIAVPSALSLERWPWFFWIASASAFFALVLAYISVPSIATDRSGHDLKMDWLGSVIITSGLILVAYALSASSNSPDGWTSATILAPFLVGLACLTLAIYVEGWLAPYPLIPFNFFRPAGVKVMALACLLFYSTLGIWIFTTTTYLETFHDIHGTHMALWFLPMAIGGILLSLGSSSIMHRVSILLLLILSGMAWVVAPLLLALAPRDASLWAFVFPSMIAITLGVDLTYTVSIIFLSSVQPMQMQGLVGAVASILVQMAIAFGLALVQVLEVKTAGANAAQNTDRLWMQSINAFWFAVASSAVGLVVVLLFVSFPKKAVNVVGAARDEEKI